jgi:hypothetical protein
MQTACLGALFSALLLSGCGVYPGLYICDNGPNPRPLVALYTTPVVEPSSYELRREAEWRRREDARRWRERELDREWNRHHERDFERESHPQVRLFRPGKVPN